MFILFHFALNRLILSTEFYELFLSSDF